MLNIEEINNTIEELENGITSFDSCLKLASLYIVRENYKREDLPYGNSEIRGVTEVEQELNDILPQYTRYCDVKRQFQLKLVEKSSVIHYLELLCGEIREFIETLYSSTDFPEERHIIVGMLTEISNEYNE
jgi:hypothetical protein